MKLCTKGKPSGLPLPGETNLRNLPLKKRVVYRKRETHLLSSTVICPQGLASLIRTQMFMGHWKACQKSSQRETSRSPGGVVPCIASLFLHVLTNFRAFPARQISLLSKDRFKNHPVLYITAGIELWKTFTLGSTIQTQRQELATTILTHVDLGCHPYTYFTCGVSFA